MTVCTIVLSVEDKTDEGQILSHFYAVEKKTPQNYREISAVSEEECKCLTVPLSHPNLSEPSDHIMTLYIGNMWPAKAEKSHFIWLLPLQCGSYQHASWLQLLIPSKLWIEMLVQKNPNLSIFRCYKNCVETVLFSGLSRTGRHIP